MKTILLVEEDENLSRGIAFAFEKDGYRASLFGSGKFDVFVLCYMPLGFLSLDNV